MRKEWTCIIYDLGKCDCGVKEVAQGHGTVYKIAVLCIFAASFPLVFSALIELLRFHGSY
jgi:hypothetical protein